jgi:HD-GYP domain-containing protein (c-di-GMP phosphodiesterase class II)
MARIPETRWRSRPLASAGLRLFVFLAPIASAAITSALTARAVNSSSVVGPLALRWATVIVASTATLVLADRWVRRLLPLAVLLRMDLAFPGPAPSRTSVARAAANLSELEERVRIARTTGFDDDPSRAAEMILSLVAAVEAHDRATRGHAERVRVYTDLLADALKLYPDDRDRLRWVALLHDVGKLEVPVSVLNKPGPLDPRELEIVRRHPEEGARLTRPLHAWLGEWAAAISEHHERFDGRGYPRGAAGTDVSLGARVVAVADCYETMTAARPYHKPKTPAEARRELVRCSGTQFDPAIVHAFLEVPVRRLRLVTGAAALVAHTPVLRGLDRVGSMVGRVASAAAVAGGALALSIASVTLHR